jgi:hypothetical protein
LSQPIANESGEMANPEVRKVRREAGKQAFGAMTSPGIPEMPMQGQRKNGNLGANMGGQTAFSPGRRRGKR